MLGSSRQSGDGRGVRVFAVSEMNGLMDREGTRNTALPLIPETTVSCVGVVADLLGLYLWFPSVSAV